MAVPKADIEAQFAAYRRRLADGGEILFHRQVAARPDAGPLVSIIIPAFNSAKVIGEALASVHTQTYRDIELMVVDGGSRDGSVEFLMNNTDGVTMVISGPDANPADALNKAIVYATGDYVAVLPSDDKFPPDFIANAVAALQRTGSDFVFGDLIYTVEGRVPLLVPGDPNYARSIRYKMPCVNSTSMLMQRKSFSSVGLFDVNIRYSPDYDWVLRAHLAGLRGVYDPAIRTYFAHGGMSTINYVEALAAVRDVAISHGCPPARAYLAYYRGVLQKRVRDVLQRLLPTRLFHGVLRRVTRTGTKPLV